MPTNAPSANSSWVVATTQDTFLADVIDRSHERPVVVDFWAEWCQPCRMLAPILERLAHEYAGQFVLVKAETDKNQQAAMEFSVSSIPAVYGVVAGEVVDFFQGALPEPHLRPWLDRLVQIGVLSSARKEMESAPTAAESKFRSVLEKSPHEPLALIGLGECLVRQQRFDECREILSGLEKRGFLEPEAEKLKAQVDLASMGGGSVSQARAAAAANPDDFGLQLQLAEALVGDRQFEEALQTCLSLVQRDRQKTGEKARQLMVDVFRVLPGDSELIGTYRRKLSMALY